MFTLNNYQDKPDYVGVLDSLPCRFMKYGKEVGEEGTPHLQGMVVFMSPITLPSAIKKLVGCHVEIMKSLAGSLAYVGKDGDVTERGDPPVLPKEKGQKEAERWKSIRLASEEGRFDDIPEDVRFNKIRTIEYHRDQASKKRKLADTEEHHLWYWGASGTGKSRKAREENPDAYLKMCNKWWDGYEDQSVVLIEDLDVKHDVLAHHLKIWGDRYPFLAEYKGGAKKVRPAKVIVTSNYHPSDIWTENSSLEPILRRFKCVKFMKLNN